MDDTDKKLKNGMDDTDKKLKNGMDDTDEIELEKCTVTDDGVVCSIDPANYKKMMKQKKVPVNLIITVEKEIPKNKSIDGTKPTEADSSNKQGCECFKTTKNSEIANYVAKYLTKTEEN